MSHASSPPSRPAPPAPAGDDEIAATVRRCIAESLARDPSEVLPDKRLIDDLGADSLDFVDIIFQLDNELGIGARESELAFLTRLDFSSPEVMKQGHLTAEVVAQLAAWLPAIATVPDRTRITPAQMFSMITVEAICNVARRRRGAAEAPG